MSRDILPVSSPDTEEKGICLTEYPAALPSAPGNESGTVNEYYTVFPFGEFLTKRVRAEHSSHPQIWTYLYETDPEAPGYSRLKRKTYPEGSCVDYSYDPWGRLLTKCEPWVGGGHKVIRITYEDDSPDTDVSRRIREFILDSQNREYFLTEIRYLVTQTPLGKKEETRQFAVGAPVCHYSLKEWYGDNDENPICRRKLKRTQDINGIQHCYEYAAGSTGCHTSSNEPQWTRTDTLVAKDAPVPGQSTRTRETFDARGNRLHLQKYVHDGSEFVLIRSDHFEYNDCGQSVLCSHGNGTTHSTEWSPYGPVRTRSTSGAVTEFEYNSSNQLIKTTEYHAGHTRPTSQEYLPRITRNEYDKEGHLRERIEIQGGKISRTLYTYDGSGRLTSRTDPKGLTTTYSRTPDELVTQVTYPEGNTFIIQRHVRGALLCEGGTGRKTRFHLYSATRAGIREQVRLNQINGPLETEKLTNGFGQVILLRQAVAPGLMKETAFAYNEKGQKVEERTCGQAPLLLGYDILGNLSGKTLFLPGSENYEKRHSRRLETRVIRYCRDDFDPGDPAGDDESQQPLMYRKETRAVYNEQGDPVLESKAVKISDLDMREGESQIVYLDKYGHYSVLDTSLDPDTGELTSYSYLPGCPDSASKTFLGKCLIRKKERDGRRTDYTCHLGDKAEELTAADDMPPSETEIRIRHEYDGTGRLIMFCYSSPGQQLHPLFPEKEIKVGFSYDDASGALLQKQLMNQRTSYEYERNGQISRITHASGKGINFRYTPTGALSEISFDDGTPSIFYEYGVTGRLSQIHDAAGRHSFFLSHANDPEAEEHSLTGTRLEHLRDILGRPSGQILSRKGEIIQNVHLEYDRYNRIKSLRENGQASCRFTYHTETGDLSGIAYPQGVRKQWLPENKNTNRRKVKYQFPHTLPTMAFAPSAEKQGKTKEDYILYHLSGQLHPAVLSTNTGMWQITYNALPLPAVFQQEDKRIELLYDYRGRCVEKFVYYRDILMEKLRYAYSDNHLLAEFDATSEQHSKSPLLLCSYVWSPISSSPLSMTLWKNGIGTTCYYLHDADNNVRGLVDKECRLRAAYQYTESGLVVRSDGDLAEINPFRFGSMYYDEDLGLYLSLLIPPAFPGVNGKSRPPGAPVPPSFLELCLLPFSRQGELDKLFSKDRRKNL